MHFCTGRRTIRLKLLNWTERLVNIFYADYHRTVAIQIGVVPSVDFNTMDSVKLNTEEAPEVRVILNGKGMLANMLM